MNRGEKEKKKFFTNSMNFTYLNMLEDQSNMKTLV